MPGAAQESPRRVNTRAAETCTVSRKRLFVGPAPSREIEHDAARRGRVVLISLPAIVKGRAVPVSTSIRRHS
jgi:hypothetical protein